MMTVSEDQEHRVDSLLRAENVFKNYRIGRKTIEVLHGVDFTLETQGFVAIHGASGAGKSTLLHVLGGLDTPDSGDLWFNGQSFRSMKRGRLTRFRNSEIGFIFQAYHLFPEFSALENVCLPGRIARRPVAELTEAGGKLLELVGLKDRMDHRPYELSGGEQQRVAIARALINNPSLILADEPTGNLDSKTGGDITELLEQLREDLSIALVLATHDLSIGDRADRVVHLVDGKMQLNA
jgi:ABC-type lipoprotein export system ATPase subunit